MEAQAARSNELATSVAGLQALHADHMQELEDGRRSVALMDEAMAVSGHVACVFFMHVCRCVQAYAPAARARGGRQLLWGCQADATGCQHDT